MSAAQDVVALLDSNLQQVLPAARAMKVTVKEDSKAMEHPLETGATTTDHRILLPVEIELSVIVSGAAFAAVYQQMRQMFRRGDLLTVQTRSGSYVDMLPMSMPHEESADMVDALAIAFTLRETVFVTPSYTDVVVKPVASKHSGTVKRGEQQPKTSAQEPRKGSILSGIFR